MKFCKKQLEILQDLRFPISVIIETISPRAEQADTTGFWGILIATVNALTDLQGPTEGKLFIRYRYIFMKNERKYVYKHMPCFNAQPTIKWCMNNCINFQIQLTLDLEY